jgi:hypothetical protein
MFARPWEREHRSCRYTQHVTHRLEAKCGVHEQADSEVDVLSVRAWAIVAWKFSCSARCRLPQTIWLGRVVPW